MFDPSVADFSGITGGHVQGGTAGLFVSDVIQAVRMEVNEGKPAPPPPSAKPSRNPPNSQLNLNFKSNLHFLLISHSFSFIWGIQGEGSLEGFGPMGLKKTRTEGRRLRGGLAGLPSRWTIPSSSNSSTSPPTRSSLMGHAWTLPSPNSINPTLTTYEIKPKVGN